MTRIRNSPGGPAPLMAVHYVAKQATAESSGCALPSREIPREDPSICPACSFLLPCSVTEHGSNSPRHFSRKTDSPTPPKHAAGLTAFYPTPTVLHWDNWDTWDKSPRPLPIGRLMFPIRIFTPGQHWDTLGHFIFRTYQGKRMALNTPPVAVLLGRPRRSYAAFSLAVVIHSQPRPSIPAGSLVRVIGQGCECFAAPQPVRVRCIGSTGDNLPACSRQASAAVSQLGTLSTPPPVIAAPFGRNNAGQAFNCRGCFSVLILRAGIHQRGRTFWQHRAPINHHRTQTTQAGYEPRGCVPQLARLL